MLDKNKYKFAKELGSQAEYQDMGDALVDFVRKEISLNLDDFPLSLNINPKDFMAFTDKYFLDCLDLAKNIVSSNILRLARIGTIDIRYALQILPLYNTEYAALMDKRNRIASDKDQNQPNVINVIIPPIGDKSK